MWVVSNEPINTEGQVSEQSPSVSASRGEKQAMTLFFSVNSII